MNETSKSTLTGVFQLAAGALGLIGGCVLLTLGLVGGGIIGVAVPPDFKGLAALPLVLFVPLSLLCLTAGGLSVAGGLSALQRKRWGLAVVGSVAALVCFPPLGVLALIFTLLAENEFADAGPARSGGQEPG